MCADPVTMMMAASAAMSLLGSVGGAMGAMSEGKAQQQAANARAAMARQNAALQEQAAADAVARGKIQEQRLRLKVEGVKGAQRAAFGASGVAMDEGSPLDILADTAGEGELDALTIRNNADREAYGYRLQGWNSMAEASMSEWEGRRARAAGKSKAFTSLLSGAGKLAGAAGGFGGMPNPGGGSLSGTGGSWSFG